MSEATIAAGFFSGLLDYAAEKGAGRDGLLARCSLTDADIADQDARVPLDLPPKRGNEERRTRQDYSPVSGRVSKN